MKLCLCVLLAAVLCAVVLADLPIHCLHQEAVGKWTFQLEEHSGTGWNTCGHFVPDSNIGNFRYKRHFKPSQSFEVYLEDPNIAVESGGHKGTWTMVYDEGFEVNVGGISFFSFFKYSPRRKDVSVINDDDSHDYISHCDETLVGWYKDDTGKVGCFKGVQSEAKEVSHRSVVTLHKRKKRDHKNTHVKAASLIERQYRRHLVDKINSMGLSWQAQYSEHSTPRPGKTWQRVPVALLQEPSPQPPQAEPAPKAPLHTASPEAKHGAIHIIPTSQAVPDAPAGAEAPKIVSKSAVQEALTHAPPTPRQMQEAKAVQETLKHLPAGSKEQQQRAAVQAAQIQRLEQQKHDQEAQESQLQALQQRQAEEQAQQLAALQKLRQSDQGKDQSAAPAGKVSVPASLPAPQPAQVQQHSLPREFDWRKYNGTNFDGPVRAQGGCGSCYAFAFAAAAEARVRVMTKGKDQVHLSPQAPLSCSYYNQGCEGGYPYLVARYAQEFGIPEDECMAYLGTTHSHSLTPKRCKRLQHRCHLHRRYFVKDYSYIGGFYGATNTEEQIMKELMTNGPVTCCMEIHDDLWNSYKGGVMTAERHKLLSEGSPYPWVKVNHAVSVVGWGVDDALDNKDGLKYWILKTSDGRSFGENGYLRLKRGTNELGIESMCVAFSLEQRMKK